jgi:hypothetical protein
MPPNRNIQYDQAFSRGNATSRAPIISGEQVVREARPHRDHDEEDHRRAVQGQDLVVLPPG